MLGPGGLGVFVNKDGSSERPPIAWPNKISQLVVHNHLNVIALTEDIIYIHRYRFKKLIFKIFTLSIMSFLKLICSLIDYQTCHEINLPGVKCLSLSEGNLYVGASRSLFRLNPVSTEQQVEVRKSK